MRMEEVNARKAYIQNIRKSFDSPGKSYEWEQSRETQGEASDSFSFFKVRLLLAVFIFAAYILCDRTNTLFYRYSAGDIVEKIEENYNLEETGQELLETFHQTMRMR